MLGMLTSADPRWSEFAERLNATLHGLPGGCNGKWDAEHAHEAARAILARMGQDVAASLVFMQLHGGYCDCEILLNVTPAPDFVEPCAGPPTGCGKCRGWLTDPTFPFTDDEREYLKALEAAQ